MTQRLGELDSGSPDTLGWFVAQSLTAHPAERTALVVWDHGLGWQGIAFDENVTAAGGTSAPSYLDAAELGRAVDAGLAAAGREQLDLLILDACLMANFEVVSEAHGNAGHLISSEELVPGLGLDYDAFAVFADPAPTWRRSSTAWPPGSSTTSTTQSPVDADMMTLSLIDLAQAPALDQAMTAFAQAAAADVAAEPARLPAGGQRGVQVRQHRRLLARLPRPRRVPRRPRRLDGDVGSPPATHLLATLDAAVVDQIGHGVVRRCHRAHGVLPDRAA